jgi:DNA (cytosine-5)-methyltransferase 1
MITMPVNLTGQLSEVKASIERLELLLADQESREDETGRRELDETICGTPFTSIFMPAEGEGRKRGLNALSLFSGIGGMDKAAEDAGIKTVAFCEKEPFCQAVLRERWPGVPIFEDIKELRGDMIGTPIDVIHGGPPCQPVSVAGRRRGKDDERYLWGEVFRVVAEIMPRFCVFENVPGILNIAADDICKNLERLGYSVGICCFEAAAVGAPHRRARVFFVAHSESGRS